MNLSTEERRIWSLLRRRAVAAPIASPEDACLHYRDVARIVDPDGVWRYPMTRPPFRGLNDALGRVSAYEHAHGRPLLSSLVTRVDDNRPGDGFASFARELGIEVDDPDQFWHQEVAKIVSFWSSGSDIFLLDAAVDQLTREMRKIRALLSGR